MAADASGRPMVAEIKEEVSSGIRGAAQGGARRLVGRRGTYTLLYVAIVDMFWAMW